MATKKKAARKAATTKRARKGSKTSATTSGTSCMSIARENTRLRAEVKRLKAAK